MLTSPIKFALSRHEIRTLDQQAIDILGIPAVILMENAGRCVSESLLHHEVKDLVVICCGKGNNGGDGFVVARYLDNHNIPVRVLLFAEPHEITGEAKIHFDIINKMGITIIQMLKNKIDNFTLSSALSEAEWIVDALFGTGLKDALRSPYDIIISAMNHTKAKIVAVDVPSGLDCETGRALGKVVNAHFTVTFTALKKGFLNPDAQRHLGQVEIADIGIPSKLLP